MGELIRGVPFDYEPKRENRFFLEFPNEIGIEEWKIQEVKRPSMTINSVEIPFINETNYVAGKYKWESIDIKLIDVIGPSTSTQVMEWVRLHAESLTGRMGYAAGYKKNIELEMLDPTGVVVEKWILEGTFITDLNFNELDYSRDDLATITCSLRMDRCIQVF